MEAWKSQSKKPPWLRPKRNSTVAYLSGPMTGIEEFNRPAFQKAAQHLRDLGFEVIDPGEGEEYDTIEKAALAVSRQKLQMYLSRDIDLIQEMADVVVLMPGWEDSNGCKLEVAVADAVGVPVFELATGALLRDKKVVLNVEEKESADMRELPIIY